MNRVLGKTSLIFIVMMMSSVVAAMAKKPDPPLSRDREVISNEFGEFVVTNVVLVSDDRYGKMTYRVSGSVTNNTNRTWRYARFEVHLEDGSGGDIKSKSGFETHLEVHDIKKGETKLLLGEDGGNAEVVTDGGKASSFQIGWNGDNSYYDSNYVFSLTRPLVNDKLAFEDELIAITIDPVDMGRQIGFVLTNKTGKPITVNWDHVSIIDLEGTSHKVIHAGVKLADREQPQSTTPVPPTARISDFLAPSDLISWNAVIGMWLQGGFLPPSQNAIQVKGKSFSVFMPLLIGGDEKDYLFTILIKDVEI